MATYIVGLVLIILLGFAFKKTLSHFRGEGACCGGSVIEAPKKELTGTIIGKKEIKITGMTCGNCKARVEHLLNGIDGAAAEVNLHYNKAELSMTREVSDEEIRTALDGSGYEITAITAV